MAIVSELSVMIGAEGTQTVINALKQVEGAQTQVVSKNVDVNNKASTAVTGYGNALSQLGGTISGLGGPFTTIGNVIGGVGQKMDMLTQVTGTTTGTTSGLKAMIGGIPPAALAAAGAVGGLVVAYKGLQQAAKLANEGAEMEYAFQKFNNLSRSIGVSGKALLADLKETTRGVVSDFELVSSATQLMSLGLVKTRDEAVRLTDVASALGWNMNELVMTITNQSSRRLDQLNLSVEAVMPRFEELKASGVEAGQAMAQALVEAGEALRKLQGHVADTNLGVWKQIDAMKENISNDFKMWMTQEFNWTGEIIVKVTKATESYVSHNKELAETKNLYFDLRKKAEEYGVSLKGIESPFVSGGMGGTRFDLEIGKRVNEQIDGMIKKRQELIASYSELPGIMSSTFKSVVTSASNMAEGFKTPIAIIKSEIDQLTSDITNANFDLDIAVKTFHQSVAGDLAKGLENAGLKGDELVERLGILDEMFGTTYVMEYEMKLATDDLLKTLIEDPDSFKSKFAAFDSAFTPLQKSVKEAMDQVSQLQTKLKLMAREYLIRVRVDFDTGSVPNYPGIPFPKVPRLERALGGKVYPNTPYLVGERGPELFVPQTTGSIVPNEAITNQSPMIVQNVTVSNDIDIMKLARAVAEELSR